MLVTPSLDCPITMPVEPHTGDTQLDVITNPVEPHTAHTQLGRDYNPYGASHW